MDVARAACEFYVGATELPWRRWVGSYEGDDGGRRGRGICHGHAQQWERMAVITVLPGPASARMEARLIGHAMNGHYSDKCTNKVADARGLSVAPPNFIYVVWR